jgi:Fic family protein
MGMERYANSPIGRLVPVEVLSEERRYRAEAFVPDGLRPTVQISGAVATELERAVLALGRLDGAARRLPNPWLLARPAIRREAISSSSLEGTVSTMNALLASELFEGSEDLATAEVRNFVMAMEQGVQGLEELPVSLRLIRQLHSTLLSGVRGDSFRVGELRSSQNWIGPAGSTIEEAQFVPPPAGEILRDGLSDWEKWIHTQTPLPLLVRVALAHYQFETLHPFDDGNGRIGRLVALLMMIEADALTVPLLDISTWLEAHRDTYIEHLRAVSESGNFDPWLLFFMRCIAEQSKAALDKTILLLELGQRTVGQLRQAGVRGMALEIAESLIGYPYLTVRTAAEMTDKTYQGASNAVAKLLDHEVLRPLPGDWYPQVYYAPEVFAIIN